MDIVIDISDIRKAFEQLETEVDDAMRETGENAIQYATSKTRYQNRTYRLRNSPGYAITDGRIKEMRVADNYGREEAVEATAELLNELDHSGRSLILAVGMPYGSYVEAKGYDVLSGAALNAVKELNKK